MGLLMSNWGKTGEGRIDSELWSIGHEHCTWLEAGERM